MSSTQQTWGMTTTTVAARFRFFIVVATVFSMTRAENNTKTGYRECRKDDFLCEANGPGSGPCLSKYKKCNGYFDCHNKKDEENCGPADYLSCQLDEFRCKNGQKCIDPKLKCDYTNDCGDNSDEYKCNFPVCDGSQFRCRNQYCIPINYQCDGYADCQDGTDELNCTFCAKKSQLYDGRKNCDDIIVNNEDENECSKWGFCEQLCEEINESSLCSCYPGYNLVDNRKCVVDNQTQSFQIYFVQESNIVKMNSKFENQTVITDDTSADSMDYHYSINALFWSDSKSMKIKTIRLLQDVAFIRDENVLSSEFTIPGLWKPISIAVDWIGNKLYIVDGLGKKIDVIELNGRWHAIILNQDLTNPYDIALDPTRGYIFVTEVNQLIRLNMDGTDAKAIVTNAIYQASRGISVDIFSRRLYWGDTTLCYIDTVDYNGNDRRLIIREPHVLSASLLAVFERMIYWWDDSKQSVLSINKYDRTTIPYANDNNKTCIKNPKSMKIVHSLLQRQLPSPCGKNNGGCQHMCILTNGNDDNSLSYTCACNVGYQLNQDLHSCLLIDEFLFYSQSNCIRSRIFNNVSQSFNDAILPIWTNSSKYLALDFDAHNNYIYYSSYSKNSTQSFIYRMHKNGTGIETLLELQNGKVEGLAMDWITKNLYYTFTNYKNGTIGVINTRNITNKIEFLSNLKSPRAIVVHPNKGYIFFSQWDSPASISRLYTDGSNLIVFRNIQFEYPNGLAIDFTTNRLYWCEGEFNYIQHSDLDGKDVKTIRVASIKLPFSIATFNNWIYITDWKLNALIKIHKLTGLVSTIFQEKSNNRFYGVKIYSQREQLLDNSHPCSVDFNYGDCQKLCFGIPSNNSKILSVQCGCPDGEEIDTDDKTCRTVLNNKLQIKKCTNTSDINKNRLCHGNVDCILNFDDEQICTDGPGSVPCLPESKKCDGYIDYLNKSDEENCSPNYLSCHTNQFQCNNHSCIPLDYRCDGYKDCDDGRDELNCSSFDCTEKYQCPHNGINKQFKCIQFSQLCDGHRDCDDNSDEDAFCSTVNCPTLDCEYKCQASPSGGACYCPENKKIGEDSKTCIDRDGCSKWGFCEQLCEKSNGSFKCNCYSGYSLVDYRKCVADNLTQPYQIYYAQESSIVKVDSKYHNHTVVVNHTSANSIDYHYSFNILFWSDIKSMKIKTTRLFKDTEMMVRGMNETSYEITLPSVWEPISVAVDWIGNKLYVVDKWGKKIDVIEMDGRWYAIVLNDELTNPSDIALDPTRGYIFIADTNQLIRANMDGAEAKPIVTDNVYRVTGISVDIFGERLYWGDTIIDYIETVDYEGNDRRILLKGHRIVSPSRLSVFEDKVYWTDDFKQNILSTNKFNTTITVDQVKNSLYIKYPKSVKIIHSSVQRQVQSPCGKNNGGCQHMCIISRSINKSLAYKCVCNTGYQNTYYLSTCSLITEFLLYSQQTSIRGRIFNNVTSGFNDAIPPIRSKGSKFIALDFDAHENYIYYSDILQGVVYKINKNGTGQEIILKSQNEVVESLAVDWVAKNLYYLDSKNGTINVLSTRNVTNKKTLLKNLKTPKSIVVHPNKGYIFFLERSEPPKISRMHTDSSNLIMFDNIELGWPNGLAIDFVANRLYWSDAMYNHIQHSNLDGLDVNTFKISKMRHPYSMCIHQERMYISDWRLNAVIRMHMLTGVVDRLIEGKSKDRFYGVKLYSKLGQRIDKSQPCSAIFNYGGCEKFCFTIPSNGSKILNVQCGCPDGENIDMDGKTCVAESNKNL